MSPRFSTWCKRSHAEAKATGFPSRRFVPDAVVCDLGLPEMNGYEVARILRTDPATAAALLICVSGYGQEQDRRQAHEAGFDHYLVKPAEIAEVHRLLMNSEDSPARRASQGIS
ncbi:MAG TPA: response regulator [Gemmataceae bacterium]|nr:response regulator [Gemmataceae bacterium]